MTMVLIIGAFIFLVVFVLIIFTINKGYAYKHTIDERPSEYSESIEETHRQEG